MGSISDLIGTISNPPGSIARSGGSISYPALGGITTSGYDDVAWFIEQNALVNLNSDGIVGASTVTAWTNSGTGGSDYDLNVQLGTAANRRRHPSGSVLLFGGTGDRASTPNSVAASIAGSIDIRWVGAMADWTPAAFAGLVAKWGDSGARSYALYLTNGSAGTLTFQHSPDGSAVRAPASTVPTGFSDGSTGGVRVTFNAATGDTTFYKSDDLGQTWQQLGDVVAGAPEGLFESTTLVTVGSDATGSFSECAVYRAQIYNGINGTLAVDMDPTQWTTGTTFSSGGATWTLNGNSFIQNTGYDCVTTIGSTALETTAGQTIASPGTVFAVVRYTNPNPGFQLLHSARSNDALAWYTRTADDNFSIYQGSASITLDEAFDTNLHVLTSQFLGTADSSITASGLGSKSGDAGSTDWDFGTLFADTDGSQSAQVILAQLIVFPSALSASQISAIQAYLKQKYGTV